MAKFFINRPITARHRHFFDPGVVFTVESLATPKPALAKQEDSHE